MAERLSTCAESVRNWERGHTEPALSSWPAVIGFLGYVPFETGGSLANRIRAWRKAHGVPRGRFADLVGADEATVWRWEAGRSLPGQEHRARLERVLGGGARLQDPDPKKTPPG